jgi:hypothetical protein
MTQIVWGRFHFFKDRAAAKGHVRAAHLLDAIEPSQLSICVVDNMTYVVFTKALALVCDLLSDDWPIEVRKGPLQELLRRQGEL